MLGYRKRSFERAHSYLQELKTTRENLAVLKKLQQLLLHEIIRAEENIKVLKSQMKLNEKDSNPNKKKKFYINRIEKLRTCLYIWKCFGDSIAFIYVDKYALKQVFYNTQNKNPKSSAGFIHGKIGLNNEIEVLESLLGENIPALLCDLTNTIRHGDVCILVGPDPYLIEVKSSKNTDSRGRKQRDSIRKIHSFFENDKVDDLREMKTVNRTSFKNKEVTFSDEFNKCLNIAFESGYSVTEPERGLYYIAITEWRDFDDFFDFSKIESPIVFSLNGARRLEAWSPYRPFILGIYSFDILWSFIMGRVYIMVVCDKRVFTVPCEAVGYSVDIFSESASSTIRINKQNSDPVAEIGAHMISRIGFEFVSPKWIIDSVLELVEDERE